MRGGGYSKRTAPAMDPRRLSRLEMLLVVIAVLALLAVAAGSQPCHKSLTVDISNAVLRNRSYYLDGTEYPEGTYFTDDGKLRGCACLQQKCIRLCCPTGHSMIRGKCVPGNYSGDISVDVYRGTVKVNVSRAIFKSVVNQECDDVVTTFNPLEPYFDKFFLQEDGSLQYKTERRSGSFANENFCFAVFTGLNNTVSVRNCHKSFTSATPKANYNFIGMLVSLPFLLITLFIYLFVPELKNMHGLCLICYVASLMVAYSFLVVKLIVTLPKTLCLVSPFVIYYSFMASFAWLNVMSIDIWWTFSGHRVHRMERSSNKKKFVFYSIYAWSLPLILTSIVAFVQFNPNLINPSIHPGFGKGICWFSTLETQGFYFYLPMCLSLLCNIILFGRTTWQIYVVKKDIDKSMKHESTKHSDHNDKQRYKIYLKLMLVFGINWIVELISWGIGPETWLVYVLDLINAFYGVVIFVLFVYKRNVWRLMKKRYLSLIGRPYQGHSSFTGTTGIPNPIRRTISATQSITNSTVLN